MAVIAMRAESLNDAVNWARESVTHNPRRYEDREYNLACALAKRGSESDKAEALGLLERGFTVNAFGWRDAWEDRDFDNIREELSHSRFADPQLVKTYRDGKPRQG